MPGLRAPLPSARIAAFAAALVACCVVCAPAHATVSAAQLIDGPSADLLELGGAAMAPDGTGGIVYRKVDGGRAHVFAAQYVGGTWRPAQRVDAGRTQAFESTWPVIAAGNGGRLVVVWAQEFGAADRLFSASLQPGARQFEAPVPVDLNVGDASLGLAPSVAMAAGGQALLTYRVVTDAQPAGAADGGVLAEIRVARLTGQLWSSLGTPMNRNTAALVPALTGANGPRIGVDQTGAGVVAWSELDDEFAARVYFRRVFAGGVGIARQVTPREIDGARSGPTDAFALSVGRFGEAAVAWRQQPFRAADGGPRVWAAAIADQFSSEALAFAAPRLVDGGGAAAPGAGALGAPSVSIAGPDALVGLSVGSTAQAIEVTETDVAAPVRLDRGDAAPAPGTAVALGSDGSAALAWRLGAGGRGTVRLQERRSDGVLADRVLTGPRGGAIDDLLLGGSGLGDGLAAFTQGTGAGRQVVSAVVDAAPQTFSVQAPLDWVRDETVRLEWDPAAAAVGKVSYAVVVDDDVAAENLRGTTFDLPTDDLEDGRRTVAVVATDAAGQETSSVPAVLRFDGTPPTLRTRVLKGRRLEVRLDDGAGSGVLASSVRVSFGNGGKAAGKRRTLTRLARPGRYRVVVRVQDKAGNKATLSKTVRVR